MMSEVSVAVLVAVFAAGLDSGRTWEVGVL
jgi:hypothetical protein